MSEQDQIRAACKMLRIIRGVDHSWSERVQKGETPYDSMIARGFRHMYEHWRQAFQYLLDKDLYDSFKTVDMILLTDFEESDRGMKEAIRGEFVLLGDVIRKSAPEK